MFQFQRNSVPPAYSNILFSDFCLYKTRVLAKLEHVAPSSVSNDNLQNLPYLETKRMIDNAKFRCKKSVMKIIITETGGRRMFQLS